MAIALPGAHTPRNDSGDGIARKSGRMSGHQQKTLVWSWIAEVRRLHGIVERTGFLQVPKSFLFDRAENLRIDIESAILRQAQSQDGERIVMARKAGALLTNVDADFWRTGSAR